MLFLISSAFCACVLMVFISINTIDDQHAKTRTRNYLGLKRDPDFDSWKMRLISQLMGIRAPRYFEKSVDGMIPDKAGIYMKEEQFKAFWWLLTVLGVFLALVTVGFGGGQMNNVGFGMVLILIPLVGPYFYLKWRLRERENAVARNLPDFLDMLSLTMEAGLGFMTALERVSMNSTGIFYLEIQRVLVLINLGYSRREALRELVRRLPSSDLSHLVESINLAEQLGTSLTRTLRMQTNLLRWRRRQRAEVKAQTISIRIIPALVFFFLPSLLLVYLAPPILNFLFNR